MSPSLCWPLARRNGLFAPVHGRYDRVQGAGMARIFGIDLRTLALFRILLGLAILADIGNLAPWAADFFSDKGVLPRAAALEALSGYRFSLYLANGKTAFVLLLMAVQVLAALALILGWRTRAMTALNWLLLASLVNRNPIILQGGDQLITLLAFWGMFLPLGARFSIDAALDANAAPAPGDGHLSVATAAMLGQVLYVYFFGALLKESPIWIPEGLAVYYATQLDSFATPIGHWLRDQLGLTRALTYFVWSIELAAPFLLLSPVWHLPLRLLALAALVAMHLGFALCLHIGLFWAISIASLSLFVPGAGWDWLGRRVYPPAKRRIALFYDEGCVFCEKTCRLLRTFCLTRDNPIRPAQGDAVAGPLLAAHKSWVVLDA
ncbi:MAG: HTTM domain-containing protein, partial [Alphaproteobacteria bacterium]